MNRGGLYLTGGWEKRKGGSTSRLSMLNPIFWNPFKSGSHNPSLPQRPGVLRDHFGPTVTRG